MICSNLLNIMACSKLLSGDLPELLNEIIQYFHHDYKTLHSCILVNRLWCRLAIPLLWKDPFSIKFSKNYHFIKIYLHNLNEEDKIKLNEYGNIVDLFPSNTSFNYPNFIQHLNTRKIISSIDNWVSAIVRASKTKAQNSSNSMQNIDPVQWLDFTKLIYRLLFLVFIKNEINLLSFEVIMVTPRDFQNFVNVLELILQKSNFISNIKNFNLSIQKMNEFSHLTRESYTEPISKFLIVIYSNCHSILSLSFLFPLHKRDCSIIEKNLSEIIKSQKNLKKITFCHNYKYPLYHSLLSLNCLNMLNTIIFYCIDFKDIDVLSEVFNQLNVLVSIHMIHCYSLDSKFIRQINNITKPFKLKSLFLDGVESLEMLIQKYGGYLENFKALSSKHLLLESAIKYCSNIKFLQLNFENNTNLILNLIENITQNLNYLTIYNYFGYHDNHTTNSSIILQNLGQILPPKLEYLNLNFEMNGSDLEVFLKNSQSTFIKKLLINNEKKKENGDIFPYVKESIMKMKRVKYLAILETFYGTGNDLFSLKDEVKEFELYDIQVLSYDDLYINTEYFLKEIS